MNLLLADQLPARVSERKACRALNLCRSSLHSAHASYHFYGPVSPHRRKRKASQQPTQSVEERVVVRDVLSSEAYRDQPPAQVYYSLLEQGTCLCSVSTMHRVMRKNGFNCERRQQRPASPQPIPLLKATAPLQVWSWDIAKLPTRKRGEYLSLYVIMDLFNRYIVAWMRSRKESSALSSHLIAEAYMSVTTSSLKHSLCTRTVACR